MTDIEHPCPELEDAFNNLMKAFDSFHAKRSDENLEALSERIEEMRDTGGLVITGEER